MSMVIVGDSISNEFLSTNDGKYGSETWPNVMAVLSGGRIHVKDNAGIPGQVSATLASNIGTYLSIRYPSHVLIYIGVNDVSTGVATATISANILSMVDQVKWLNLVPILCTVCPRYTVTLADIPKITALNDEIRNIAQMRNVPIIDLFARAVDVTTGLWKDGYTRDGLHPNQAGAKYLADWALDWMGMSPKFYHSPNFAQTNYDNRNLLANGLFLGAPDNWSLTGGGSLALLADPDILGNWAVITAVSEAETSNLTNSASITGLTAGDRLCLAGRVWQDIVSVASGGGVTVKITFAGAAAGLELFAPVYLATQSYPRTAGFSMESVVPAGATSATASVTVAGVVGVVRVAQLKIQNLTANNAAIAEPNSVLGTRGVPTALQIHNLTGNASMGATTPSTSTIGPSLKVARHAQAGTANLGGPIATNHSQVGTVGSTITDLRSNNVAGGTLSLNGDYLRCSAGGSFAANANAKRVWAYLGASLLFDSGALAFNAGDWALDIEIMRTGATTQIVKAVWSSGNSLLPATVQFSTGAVTLASNATFKVTGQGVADNDVLQKIHLCEFFKGWG